MQLQIINSNSLGNAYILSNEQEALLIECGVNFHRIKEALNFNLKKVVGCIMTHEHMDHATGAKDVVAAGINIYSTEGTFQAIGLNKSHRAVPTFDGDVFNCGGFRIKPFSVKHDAADPLGYLIWHKETGVVLFMTDTKYCEYKFEGLNNIIIEANYSQDILDRKLYDGNTIKMLRDRVINSHMSIETCKLTLSSYDLSKVNNIVLIHLSDGNSDARRFKAEVEQTTGKRVHVADKGMTIPFNKTPF